MRFGVKGVFVCGNIVVCFGSCFLCNSLLHNDIYYICLVFCRLLLLFSVGGSIWEYLKTIIYKYVCSFVGK